MDRVSRSRPPAASSSALGKRSRDTTDHQVLKPPKHPRLVGPSSESKAAAPSTQHTGASATVSIGATLGRFTRQLGQGASGIVVEAKRKRRVVAIKLFAKGDEAAKNERKMLQRLRENDGEKQGKCIRLLDYFRHDGVDCIVMPCCPISLSRFLTENGGMPFPMSHIQSVARQLLAATSFLQTLTMIHTNIKPDNILLCNDAYQTFVYKRQHQRRVLYSTEIRLADFGSSAVEKDTRTKLVTTCYYRAPEVILGRRWSYAIDVWSVYYVSGLFIHLYVTIYLLEGDPTPNRPVVVIWAVTLVLEISIFTVNVIRLTDRHQVLRNIVPGVWTIAYGPDTWDYVDISINAFRLIVLLFLLGVHTLIAYSRSNVREKSNDDDSETAQSDETMPLLGATDGPANGSANGTTKRPSRDSTESSANGSSSSSETLVDGTTPGASPAEETAFYRPRKLPHKTWWEYLTSYSLFFPYLWPRDSARLKRVVVVCFLILIVQRIVNFLVPNQIGHITDAFEAGTGMPWVEILIFIFYKVL
ncbi:hypothetical protein SPBR_08963 [Sporothrix brasiliensis 5110]|uniref:Protein kinase domain-containing protein n=1 Tax=Sporothrix brasiliensis 5110 TaxID=1398154 RepID=A0A0C2EQV9_9PEZI|nr:uncharacterized protein SPBR_08963 [Sporothrix brasiliensis 5110]KIH88714.1 hypothetical protein SPBR_08963 [Sporothrix brasiliensis 5110]